MERGDGKLVILRGPSGAGKTTVAKKLFELAADDTVLIAQDYYRFIFKPPGHGLNSQAIHEMIEQNVRTALKFGCDVILEGILSMRSYKAVFANMFEAHPVNNHMFYFDVPFEETLRRHAMRQSDGGFGPDDMKAWYPGAGPAGYEFEQIIPADFSVEQAVHAIRKSTGL